MTDSLIMGLLAFLAAILAVIKPIISLNANIVELNITLKEFKSSYEINKKQLDEYISDHKERIGELEKTTATHDIRITAIEKGGK